MEFFLFAIGTTILFVLFKIVEMYLEKEIKPLKIIVRDSILVFGASLSSAFGIIHVRTFIHDFVNVITENKGGSLETTNIFTDSPGF